MKDWTSLHNYGACVMLHLQQEGWVSGWQMPATCLPSPEGDWHMGERCVCPGTFLWWPRGACVGILPHPGSRGGSFSPQNRHVLLKPMLKQGEGCQGEAKCLCRDTSGVAQPCVDPSVMLWMLVAWDSPFQTGTPCLWQHCL